MLSLSGGSSTFKAQSHVLFQSWNQLFLAGLAVGLVRHNSFQKSQKGTLLTQTLHRTSVTEWWTRVKIQPAVSAAHGTGESSQDNQPADNSDFCAI